MKTPVTKETIIAMPSGKDLDILANEMVFGILEAEATAPVSRIVDSVPRFSKDMSAAWQIVAEMRKKEFRISLQEMTDGVYIKFCPWENKLEYMPAQISQAAPGSDAEAITKAALIALL